MLRIRTNSNNVDRLFSFLCMLCISYMYAISFLPSFSSYILCVRSRTRSNAICAFENASIFRIIDINSKAAPMYARTGTCKEAQDVFVIKAAKKATIKIRMKF